MYLFVIDGIYSCIGGINVAIHVISDMHNYA